MQMQYWPKKNLRTIGQKRISKGRKQIEHTAEINAVKMKEDSQKPVLVLIYHFINGNLCVNRFYVN